ncbi:MAG: M20/M25/M40 family metallo-hydrolase, partial [Sciscionella sp.]
GTVITDLPALLSRRVDPRTGTVLAWGAAHAGDAANAIPRDGALRGTVRTADERVWAELDPLISDLVRAVVAPTGVEVSVDHQRGVPPVINDECSTEILRRGIADAVGEHALYDMEQSSGGEDFAWYTQRIPGSFARLGVASGQGVAHDIHRPSFTLDERALPVGVRVLVHAALAALG